MKIKSQDERDEMELSKIGEQSQQLVIALRNRFPDFTEKEIFLVYNTLIEEISTRLSQGESLAFLKHQEDGNYELTIFGLHFLEEVARKALQ